MGVLKLNEGSHWYTREGLPMHEIPRADGKGLRPVTLRDARKLDLLPSVSNIGGVISKQPITNYLIEKYLIAAVSTERFRDESVEQYVERIVENANVERNRAAKLGTEVHAAIEKYMEECEYQGDHKPYVDTFSSWFHENVIESEIVAEQSFANGFYGGRVDLHGTLKSGDKFVLDIKTQNCPDTKKKFNIYDSWGVQLAAYKRAILGEQFAVIINWVISTQNPSRFHVHTWEDDEPLYNEFCREYDCWSFYRKWNPDENKEKAQQG